MLWSSQRMADSFIKLKKEKKVTKKWKKLKMSKGINTKHRWISLQKSQIPERIPYGYDQTCPPSTFYGMHLTSIRGFLSFTVWLGCRLVCGNVTCSYANQKTEFVYDTSHASSDWLSFQLINSYDFFTSLWGPLVGIIFIPSNSISGFYDASLKSDGWLLMRLLPIVLLGVLSIDTLKSLPIKKVNIVNKH